MSNGQISPLQNAAIQGSILGGANGMSSQQMQLATQQSDMLRQYNAAITGAPFRTAPRLHIEVDAVTNGFVLAVGNERLIAKDLEELQQHFVAQVANMLLERSK